MATRNAGVATRTVGEVPVTRGSGNDYADLGVANPPRNSRRPNSR